MKQLIKKTSTLFLFILCFFPSVSFAASVYLSSPREVKVGESFFVDINADSDGELINSVSIVLDYPENLLQFSGYQDENTLIKLWIETPKEDSVSAGQIHMSGIIPGGVSGLYDPNKQGLGTIALARLRFTAKSAGSAEISFVESEILKHDGRGTALPHEKKNIQMTIGNTAESTAEVIFIDEKKPEPFVITFVEPSLFGGTPGMIIFNATDADSGIMSYQKKIGAGGWRDAKSPEPISKSIFGWNVTVRAFDFYGNFEESSIYLQGAVSLKLLLIILALLIFSILGYKMLKYRR